MANVPCMTIIEIELYRNVNKYEAKRYSPSEIDYDIIFLKIIIILF